MAPKRKKKIVKQIKLQIPSGQANPAPPVGPALGQAGLNIPEFCKAFNDRTKTQQLGMIVPVLITVFEDKTYEFVVKMSPASILIKKSLKIESGSSEPNKTKVGKLNRTQIEEIAKAKMEDLNCYDVEAAIKIIAGSARSMGVTVEL